MARLRGFALAAIVTSESLADEGLTAVRLQCIPDSNAVEIEAFVSWNDASNPYPEVDFKTSVLLIAGRKGEYFLLRTRCFPLRMSQCCAQPTTSTALMRASVLVE